MFGLIKDIHIDSLPNKYYTDKWFYKEVPTPEPLDDKGKLLLLLLLTFF
jgi:hypothetical protein